MSETSQCAQCNTQFEITDADRAFYKKMDVPEPQRCPLCRLKRRMNERNSRVLYRRKCDSTGEEIISQFHPNQPFPVYKTEVWWGDSWDAAEYGRDFDFSRPFFPQFKELKHKVPHPAAYIIAGTMENSDFTNCAGYLKNCYLIFEADYNEDCYYSNLLKKCKDAVDCSVCYEDELCYECVDCLGCYNVKFLQDCHTCRDSLFLFDCRSCSDCIACINQQQGQYMIFNKKYSKEEYQKMKASFKLDTVEGIRAMREKAAAFFLTQPHRFAQVKNNENSAGDYLYNSKNAFQCFDSKDLEECRYCVKLTLGVKSSMDYNSWGDKAELVYMCAACGDNIYNLKFCTTCTTNVSDCEYSDYCTSSTNLFGCVGLKKKNYCILNKQYIKEEYLKLKEKIIAHMRETREYGEFFPADICPYGYNESQAYEIFPMTREEALAQGFTWYEGIPFTKGQETMQLGALPMSAAGIDVGALAGQVLPCEACGKNYKLIKQELVFYKKMDVPPPRTCIDCRRAERMSLRSTPAILFHRQCMCTLKGHGHHADGTQCKNEFETTYAPERPEKVFCEVCYQKEVY